MDEDQLTYEEIADVWEKEKESKLPSDLPDNFYKRLRDYIRELEKKMEDIEVPPKTKKEKRIQKQYQRVQKISKLFFKERQKKIVLAAYHKSLGKKVNSENLIDQELELLREISTLLNELKNQVFLGEYKRKSKKRKQDPKKKIEESQKDKLETKESKKIAKKDLDDSKKKKRVDKKKDEDIPDLAFPNDISSSEEYNEVLVHIIEDVPSFVDIDATHDLKKEDVLTLREDIAEVLIKRGKAKKVKL